MKHVTWILVLLTLIGASLLVKGCAPFQWVGDKPKREVAVEPIRESVRAQLNAANEQYERNLKRIEEDPHMYMLDGIGKRLYKMEQDLNRLMKDRKEVIEMNACHADCSKTYDYIDLWNDCKKDDINCNQHEKLEIRDQQQRCHRSCPEPKAVPTC